MTGNPVKWLVRLVSALIVGIAVAQEHAHDHAPSGTAVQGQQPAGPAFEKLQLDAHFWSEGATFGDFNRDGVQDVVSGPYWYAGPTFKVRHEYYPAARTFERRVEGSSAITTPGFEGALGTENVYSDNFFAFTHDFNGDGWSDILVIGFPGTDASWFENPKGARGPWPRHLLLDGVDNESPTFADLDNDGTPELICNAGGHFGYATPDSSDPRAPWTFHPITPRGEWDAYTHGLGIGDLSGDGRMDLIESGGWWEQPASLAGNPVWKKHSAKFGSGAQYYAYDVNADGLADVIGSLDAHGYGLAWHEQVRSGDRISFRRHLILDDKPRKNGRAPQFSQLHALEVVDVDGDGLKDIVTGKRFWAHGSDGDPEPDAPAVLYWFKLIRDGRTVTFAPRLIDSDSGVGTQVVVADVNGDSRPDVIAANKKGTFVHLQQFGGLPPADAARAMSLPPGFRAHLFAGEPHVRQPIAFAIDDRGRLWVAEAYTYPVRRPEGQGTDRILVFEDRDGDGRFDRRSVFMSGLNLVSGLEIGFGGVWVGAAPHLLFIPLQDGEEPRPAGEPRIVLDGWGHEDTHETLNTFTWGPDGWLYGAHGVFTHSVVGKPGTPEAQRTKINAGIWRYHPTKQRFEVFAEGTSNPWGLDFDDHGQMITEACVIPHLWHLVQGGRFERQADSHFNPYVYDDIKTIADHLHYTGADPWSGNGVSDNVGGGHAHAGLMVYLGGSWPKQYRGTVYMNNIHGARINADILERRGSGFVARHAPDLIRFNDPWSQVVNLQYDQDGSVYMIDWYDQEQCHVDDPDVPDRGNGRIFKIVYGDVPTTRIDVQGMSDDELVSQLLSVNDWRVRHARRVLQERAAAGKLKPGARQRLRNLLGVDRGESTENATTQLRLLWTMHVIGDLGERDVLKLLERPDEYLRAWAIQLMAEDGRIPQDVLARFAELARSDASPVVRLYLASAVQRIAPEKRWEILQALHSRAEDAADHNIPLMVWYALEPLVAADPGRALKLAADSRLPRALEFSSRRVASIGSPDAMAALATTLRSLPDENRQLAVLEGMNAALRGQRALAAPAGWNDVEKRLAGTTSARVRDGLLAVSLIFGSPTALSAVRQTLADPAADLASRERALASLLNVKDAALPPVLFELLGEPNLRVAAIRGLAAYADPGTPARLIKLYPLLAPVGKREVLATLASRPGFATPLLAAVADGRISARDVSAPIAAQIRSLNQPSLTATLHQVWGIARETSPEKRAEQQRYQEIVADGEEDPDLPRGRVLFQQTCAACHRLFGEGGDIGPDITGSNRADLDYLLHNILAPNAEIPDAYRMATMQMKDGRVLAGFANERDTKTVTVKTLNETLTVPRDEIAELSKADVSMMPEGLLAPLSDAEVRDLIAYLRSAEQAPLPQVSEP